MSRETRDAIFRSMGDEVRAQQNAVELIDDIACQLTGLNRTDGRCLDIIDQHGRMTAGDLARASGLTTGAVTTVLDRLELAGHVRRVRDEHDRRRVYVEVTQETRQRLHELYAPLAARSRELMADYTVEELKLLRDFVRLGTQMSLEHAERLRAMLEEQHEREGSVQRIRRTAKGAKADMKAAANDVKLVAKEEKRKVKETAKRVVRGG